MSGLGSHAMHASRTRPKIWRWPARNGSDKKWNSTCFWPKTFTIFQFFNTWFVITKIAFLLNYVLIILYFTIDCNQNIQVKVWFRLWKWWFLLDDTQLKTIIYLIKCLSRERFFWIFIKLWLLYKLEILIIIIVFAGWEINFYMEDRYIC